MPSTASASARKTKSMNASKVDGTQARLSDMDANDAVLFRFWIRMAASHPGRVARALAKCVTLADYRHALVKLAKEERINLPGTKAGDD